MNSKGEALSNFVDSGARHVKDLEERYNKKFQVVNMKAGGTTVAGRFIADGYLIRCIEDGTLFRYVMQASGEIDEYYLNMRFGNTYFSSELKAKLDDIYGCGNYVCQVILNPSLEFSAAQVDEGYDYNLDYNKTIKLYLGVKIGGFNKKLQSIKAISLYNGINNCKVKTMQLSYFDELPKDINDFLVFETTGVKNSFKDFYGHQLKVSLSIISTFHGQILTQQRIENLMDVNIEGENYE